MMRLLRAPQAFYTSDLRENSLAVPNTTKMRTFKVFGSALLAFVFMFTALSGPFTAASADEYEDALSNGMSDYGTGGDFEKTLDKYDSEGKPDNKSFGYLIERLFSLRYLNHTPDGVAGGNMPEKDVNCAQDAPGAGTPFYHNCDVPNIATEFTQDVLSMFTQQGISGGQVQSVTLANEWFGLPSNIPNDGDVPVRAEDRDDKYTALELYGYNLRYTSYLGEWDHIKVYTAARAMSNFGFMDNIRLSARSILNGITGGLEEAGENAANSLSQGDVLGAIGGGWSGLWSGGTAATVNTVIDTSDLNVFNTYSWYRVGYGSTLYGARESSEAELSQVAEENMLNALSELSGDDATLPEDFLQLKEPPPKPKEMKSRCVVEYEDGKKPENNDGHSEKDCNSRKSDEGVKSVTWTEDGAQKEESLKDWRDANKEWFEAADKYELGCSIDVEDEDKRADNIASFYSCVPEAYSSAAKKQGDKLKKDSLDKLVGDSITAKFFSDLLLKSGGESNYNAPWYRYICTDEDGNDMTDNKGNYEKLLFSDGTMNSACSEVRAPIQNGFFGNGYDDNDQPPVDTRNELMDTSPIGLLVNAPALSTYYSNLNLGIAGFTTQTSNAILNLSFSPILDTLGVDSMVEDLIGDFRDSIFFPFAVFVITCAAFYTFARTIRTQSYREAFKNLLLIAGVFVLGTILMYKPAAVMTLADDVPSKIETTIMGTVFNVGGADGDELCTATGSSGNAKADDLEGGKVSNAPEDSVRSMMCENWRIFFFNPWQYGQWGTSFNNVYAEGSGEDNTMKNTNGSLVGDAAVDMGNDTTVNNWSLYQLEQMGSGTSTTRDYTNGAGVTDPNMYRLVDLQAGPNNGEGTDSRYLQMWSGNDPSARMGVSFMSAGVSVLGLVVMSIYGVTKIIISFMTALMLLVLPLIFLIGLIPNAGFAKLRNYFGTLGGLLLQRVILALLLAMMMKTLASVTSAGDEYMLNMLGAAIICIGFILFRKQIMDLVMKIATADAGAMMTQSGVARSIRNATPSSVRNFGRLGTRWASATASGAIGGYLVGGAAGAGKGMRAGAKEEVQKLRNRQRTQGFGLGQSSKYAADAAAHSAVQELRTAPNKSKVQEQVQSALNDGIKKASNDTEASPGKNADRSSIDAPVDKKGKPRPDKMPSARNARIMSRLQKAERELEGAKKETQKPILDEKSASSQLNVPQARRIKKAQEAIEKENLEREPALQKAEERFNKALDSAVGAEVKKHEASTARREFRDSLSDMRNVYDAEHNKARLAREKAKREEHLAKEVADSEQVKADNTNHDEKPDENTNDREV